jgi:hypothetical protein
MMANIKRGSPISRKLMEPPFFMHLLNEKNVNKFVLGNRIKLYFQFSWMNASLPDAARSCL